MGIFLTETPPTASLKHLIRPLFPRNPLFPALRSSPTAFSGASRKKQIPSSKKQIPSSDPDGDGQDNEGEFSAGTAPVNAASVFRIHKIEPAGDHYQITFSAVPGNVYQVERSAELAFGTWTIVADDLSTAGSEIQIIVPA